MLEGDEGTIEIKIFLDHTAKLVFHHLQKSIYFDAQWLHTDQNILRSATWSVGKGRPSIRCHMATNKVEYYFISVLLCKNIFHSL